MRKIISIFALVCILSPAHSQEWRSFTGPDLGFNSTTLGSTYFLWDPFKINPYNNTMWMGTSMRILRLTNEGDPFTYDISTHPDLFGGIYQGNRAARFDFNSSETYFVTIYKGLHQFNNGNIVTLHQLNEAALNLYVEADTVYSLLSGDQPLKFVNNTFDSQFSQGPGGPGRFVSRNGFYWGGVSHIAYYTPEFTVVFAQDDDVLLSNTNHDFKFKRNSDSLYTASEKGFSIAYDTTFYDTLTTFNSVNMLYSNILEFEFDKNDNIWALFGDENDDPIAIGYCENRVWSKYFDSANSPIDFSNIVGIEIDTFNNVWVNDFNTLHVYEEYEATNWLTLAENESISALRVYPNPTEYKLTIQHGENILGVNLKDINGKSVGITNAGLNKNTLELDIQHLHSGIYFLEVETKSGTAIRKIVKQ